MTKERKRKIGEWIIAIYSGLGILFLVAGLVAALETHELGSAEVASWVQAIGSVGAIVVAILVFKGQKDEEREREARSLRNSIRALEAEIAAHCIGVAEISASIKRCMEREEMNAFVETKVSFPIYASCASALGSVSDRNVQAAIINQYRWIEVFYDMVNHLGDIQRNHAVNPHPVADMVGMQLAAVHQGKIIAGSECLAICHRYLESFSNQKT